MPAVVPELAEQCVVLNGVAKTYAMTGWRVGWMIGPADVHRGRGNLQSHSTSNVANVRQRAALAAVSRRPRRGVARCATRSTARGKTMHELLAAIPGVDCLEPQGAFYCFPTSKACSAASSAAARSRPRSSSPRCCSTRRKVAIVPGEAFGAPGYARLSFALGDDDLGEGVGRIADFLGVEDPRRVDRPSESACDA